METNSDIKLLLRKYISNKMSAEELNAFRLLVRGADEAALRSALAEEWSVMAEGEPLDDKLSQSIFDQIELKTKPFNQNRTVGWGTKAIKYAAVVLLLLLSSLSVYLLVDNSKMSALTANQIVVKTADGERTTVMLPDGTSVRLNSKSALTYKQNFGLNDRQVSFDGEGFFDVAHNVEKAFIVNTHFIKVQVLGTKFNLYTYENKGKVEMSLVKGHVKVTTNQAPYQAADVQPNQKIVFEKKTGKMQLVTTDNQLETAWLSHDLVFNSESLRTVFDCVGRKFGVAIKVDRHINTNDTYTGMFDENNIREIMEILSIHYHFSYQLKGNTIYVNPSR